MTAAQKAKDAEWRMALIARTRRPTDEERLITLRAFRAAAVEAGQSTDEIDETISEIGG